MIATATRRRSYRIIASHGDYADMVAAEEAIERVVSRSGLAAADLDGLLVTVSPYGMQAGHAGEFDARTLTVRIHPAVIEHTQGLMHELGHLLSFRLGLAHAAYDTDERRSAEEAFAVEFAARHAD